ncbi:J domain-containing protein [Variovorax sp. Root411]|uniref:J domain-containing protein n=1 Tax=Variovorax sp. Root411 TaxID=1736530 RepID=UPI0039E147AF
MSRGASAAVVRASYRALAQNCHPDKNTADPQRAHRDMQALNEAYKVLSNPELRSKYDSELRELDAEVEDAVRRTGDRERQEAWRDGQAAGAASAAAARPPPPPPPPSPPPPPRPPPPPPPPPAPAQPRQQAGHRYEGTAASASVHRVNADMDGTWKPRRVVPTPWRGWVLGGLIWVMVSWAVIEVLPIGPDAPRVSTGASGAAPAAKGPRLVPVDHDPFANAAPKAPAPSAPPPALAPRESESELQARAQYNQELARLEQLVPLIDPEHSFAFDQQFVQDVIDRKKAAWSMGTSQIEALGVALQEACRAEIEINADCARTQDANAQCALARVRAFYCSRGRN